MPKHSGCWYCASKAQEVLTAHRKKIVSVDGKASVFGVALCDLCGAAPVLESAHPVRTTAHAMSGPEIELLPYIEKMYLLEILPGRWRLRSLSGRVVADSAEHISKRLLWNEAVALVEATLSVN